MRRFRFPKAAVFGTLAVLTLGATGCSSNQGEPYGVTGNQGVHQSQGEINRAAEDQRNVGRVPGWRRGVNVPANYR